MPLLHTLQRLGAVLVTAAVLYGAAPAPAAGADEPGWTAEPAAGRPGAARPYFYLAGHPAAVLEDRLTLANTTDQERTVTLRGADAHNTEDGAFAVRPAAESSGAGSWISFGGAATVRIPPRTRATVPFTVTVPPSSAPGDHPAAVVAAEGGREVGVRVHLRVSGPTLAALTVEDVSVRGRGAATVIAYTLVNRGNVALAPELAVRADGRFGKVPGRAARALPVELLPGQRVGLTEPWPGAPVFDEADLTLTVTAPGGARATATASAWFVPWGIAAWTGGGLLALGGTTLAALLLVRTRRTDGGPVEHADAGEHVRAPHDELTGASR
ncbi:COG1470 family protein [Streptomyces sp. NPDC003042]